MLDGASMAVAVASEPSRAPTAGSAGLSPSMSACCAAPRNARPPPPASISTSAIASAGSNGRPAPRDPGEFADTAAKPWLAAARAPAPSSGATASSANQARSKASARAPALAKRASGCLTNARRTTCSTARHAATGGEGCLRPEDGTGEGKTGRSRGGQPAWIAVNEDREAPGTGGEDPRFRCGAPVSTVPEELLLSTPAGRPVRRPSGVKPCHSRRQWLPPV